MVSAGHQQSRTTDEQIGTAVNNQNMSYWYDQQIKRYLLQLVRVFSNFSVKEHTSNGAHFNRVPCRYADASRMVSLMLKNNSENVINNSPQITVGIQSIQIARDRAQDPFLQDITQVTEREWDETQGVYTDRQGNLYTTKRYMPVPYNLTIQVDIWCTNTDTKLQLLEQIFVLFNPSIQLQSNDNPLDWSSVFELELTDIQWSSRSIPTGVDEQLDVATLTFVVPIWISPPAKVQRQKIIQQIINDIYSTNSVSDLAYDDAYQDFFADIPVDSRIIVAPGDLHLQVTTNTVLLTHPAGTDLVWSDIIEMQGQLTDVSRLELNLSDDLNDRANTVTGSVSADPSSEERLLFTVDSDSLMSDTLPAVDKIIDPALSRPGVQLPVGSAGQRYLITQRINLNYTEWNLEADANDIIQHNGAEWTVAFHSASQSQSQWVTNNHTDQQYKWTGTQWISSWQGTYSPGYWRLIL